MAVKDISKIKALQAKKVHEHYKTIKASKTIQLCFTTELDCSIIDAPMLTKVAHCRSKLLVGFQAEADWQLKTS